MTILRDVPVSTNGEGRVIPLRRRIWQLRECFAHLVYKADVSSFVKAKDPVLGPPKVISIPAMQKSAWPKPSAEEPIDCK